MINKFHVLYVGQIELDNIGLTGTPANERRYSDERLRFYWEVERPSFMKRCRPADLKGYEPLWAELAELASARSSASPS